MTLYRGGGEDVNKVVLNVPVYLGVNMLIYLLLFNTKYKAFQILSCIDNAEMVLYPDNFISTIKDDIMHGA